jgi:hypothetical protein
MRLEQCQGRTRAAGGDTDLMEAFNIGPIGWADIGHPPVRSSRRV